VSKKRIVFIGGLLVLAAGGYVTASRYGWAPFGAVAQAPPLPPAQRVVPVEVAKVVKQRVPVRVERDESRVRPADIARLCGDAAKLRAATGWEPAIPLEQTLADALAAARELEPVS